MLINVLFRVLRLAGAAVKGAGKGLRVGWKALRIGSKSKGSSVVTDSAESIAAHNFLAKDAEKLGKNLKDMFPFRR